MANNQTPDNIAALCRGIWELERDYELLDLKIDDVYLWQACRMYIYYQIAEKCGLYEYPHVTGSPISRLLRSTWTLMRDISIDNPFLRGGSAQICVFDHRRPRNFQGRIIDIYSWFLCKELESEGREFLLFERPFSNTYPKLHELPRRRVGLIDSAAAVTANLLPTSITASQRELISKLDREITQRFGVKLNLQRMLAIQLRAFKIRALLYGRLLDHYRVKEVYVVVAYYLAPLTASCRQRGIPVYEIQHGVINKYHLGYSFPGREPGSLQYFPDYLLQWGGNWPSTRHLPLGPEQLINHGFRYFEANTPRFRNIKKVPNRAVVISQSVHGNALARYLRQHSKTLAGWDIQYKLHPSEFNRSKSYDDLHHLTSQLDNFAIVETGDVHELLAEASVVIGVFSTVLFEALEFGCDIYVCPLNGWEYMDELLENGTAHEFSELPSPLGSQVQNE